jgi:hypothetical protein
MALLVAGRAGAELGAAFWFVFGFLVECGGTLFFPGFALGPLGAEARHYGAADRVDAGLFFWCSHRVALAARRCSFSLFYAIRGLRRPKGALVR